MIQKLLLFVFSFAVFFVAQGQRVYTLILSNTLALNRSGECVTIPRDTILKYTGYASKDNILLVSTSNGQSLPAQQDDIDQDGIWDELAFQVDIAPRASIHLQIIWTPLSKAPVFTSKTAVKLGVDYTRQKKYASVVQEVMPQDHIPMVYPCIYQSEGPIWENEKVAFRHYFDSRNGKDIFGKTKDILISDSVGVYSDYHLLQNWGLDLLKVGKSLGAGGLAFSVDNRLTRIGASKKKYFSKILQGPVRSIFEIRHEGVPIGNKSFDVVERISIWAGKYFYTNQVTVVGNIEAEKLAIGIVNLKSDGKLYETSHNLSFKSFATHCVQSDNYGVDGKDKKGDILGMAVMHASGKPNAGYSQTPNESSDVSAVTNTHYVKLNIKSGTPVICHFFAGWEKSASIFHRREDFLLHLQHEADKMHTPLKRLSL